MNSMFASRQIINVCFNVSRQYVTLNSAHVTSIVRPTIFIPSIRKFSDEETDKENKNKKRYADESRDRRVPVDIDLSIQYMKSDAFKETYKDYKIWQLFRRNFKGAISPSKPRISCTENGFISTTNPCVICRDRYLVLDYKNIELLHHFISPHTGYVYPNTVICLCSEQYEKLCVAITLAKSYGLIDFDVPLREYDYNHHYESLPSNMIDLSSHIHHHH
ncbi:Ribosomal protein S18 [Blomia tropicalis]|nr:Ribosomal protein S18 [Blomia tropicalis]